jgi:hypothetical protein
MAFSKHIHKLKATMREAFAVHRSAEPLGPDDLRLLEKVAAEIVNRRMAGPAVLFLESAGPMNFLGSQALHFLTPILNLVCETAEIERAARLLERRDMLPRLIALIEAKSSAGKTMPR